MATSVKTQEKVERYKAKHLERIVGKRKYGEHLEVKEESNLWKRLKEIEESEWQMHPHALERIAQKGIKATPKDIVSNINHSSIVEYKVDKRGNLLDERVVLVSKALVNGNNRLKAVYSLTTKQVISVWINNINDTHETLDWSLYDKNVKVWIQ